MKKWPIRIFGIFFLGLTIYACHMGSLETTADKPDTWNEERKRTYFQDSIAFRMYNGKGGEGDSLNNFNIFSRTMFADIKASNILDPLIYALEEPYIDTTKIPADKRWIRITVSPTFRKPYCIVIEKKMRTTLLTAKMTNGQGGYMTGVMDLTMTKTIDDSIFNSLSNQLVQLNFWELSADTTCSSGFDGEYWTFEAIENGEYNLLYRWSPKFCGNESTKRLSEIGEDLRFLSKIHECASLLENRNPFD